jgi:hypothetical protein
MRSELCSRRKRCSEDQAVHRPYAGWVLNRIASILLILAGLYLALLADLEAGSDMRTFGWVIVGAGVFGVIASFVFSAQRRDQP